MTNFPTDHHFVPKCYLKAFTDTQKKLWKKRNDNSRINQVHPSQICYELNAYKFRTSQILKLNNLNDEYYIERNAFKFQESNYGKLLPSLIRYQEEPRVTNKMKYKLFLETLLTIKRRNPVSKNEILERFKDSYKTEEGINKFLFFMSQETGIKKFTPEIQKLIKDYLSVESKNPDRLHDMYLSAFINKTDNNAISNLTTDLYKLKQYILFSPITYQFITSDNPGFIISNGSISNLSGFGGDFEFYFPLSPLTCLYINSKKIESNDTLEKSIYNVILKKDDVKAINTNSKLISKNFVLAYSKSVLEKL